MTWLQVSSRFARMAGGNLEILWATLPHLKQPNVSVKTTPDKPYQTLGEATTWFQCCILVIVDRELLYPVSSH